MSDLVMKLKKPYTFEGEEHTVIDLSGLEQLTAADLEKAEKTADTVNGATISPVKEMTLGFCLVLAATAAKQPVEFMKGLPAPVAIAVKNQVTGFLYGSEYLEETDDDSEN